MISTAVILSALELGCIYALVALALFLSYRILDIADLTNDGAFTLGAAVSVTVCIAGHPVLAVPAAMAAGAAAGFVTAFLQTKRGVPSILAGIITVNTETAQTLGADYSMFSDMGQVVEVATTED